MNTEFAVVVPTLNAGSQWSDWLTALQQQSRKPGKVLVIDSRSDDDTVTQAEQAGLEVRVIARSDFNHGGTRQMAVEQLPNFPVIIFLTQDAIPASPDSFKEILSCFADPEIGAAYGRQLPHSGARPIEAHARLFNYPAQGHITDGKNASRRGIKAPFLSNSFTAYRREALQAVGGFPSDTIVSEDMYVGAKMLIAGWKLQYASRATVYHSHSYNYRQELGRYFDIGVFFAREPWVKQAFGGASGEGMRFVLSEARHLLRHAPWLLLSAGIRTLIKYAGFKLGAHEARLPKAIKRRLSTQRYYWDEHAN